MGRRDEYADFCSSINLLSFHVAQLTGFPPILIIRSFQREATYGRLMGVLTEEQMLTSNHSAKKNMDLFVLQEEDKYNTQAPLFLPSY